MNLAYKDKIYNCPNCAAPIGKDDICPYCGTRLRWVPFIENTITVAYMNVQEISAECRVRDYGCWTGEFSKEEAKRQAIHDLRQKFVDILPNIMTIEEKLDRIYGEIVYRASIFIGKKEK